MASNDNFWIKERIFYSHATIDSELTQRVKEIIENDFKFELYVAERNITGKPLIEKLRDEMLNCNAIIAGLTGNTINKSTSNIISFELGLAYSLHLPIFIITTDDKTLPWFYDKLTDYAKVKDISEKEVKRALSNFNISSFRHPIEIVFPKEEYIKYGTRNQSKNISVVQDDGRIVLTKSFNDILHFRLKNNRDKSEHNVMISMRFPSQIEIDYDAGSLDPSSSSVQRTELFYMPKISKNSFNIIFPFLLPGERILEVNVKVSENCNFNGKIDCAI
jgi:hypothetical protein